MLGTGASKRGPGLRVASLCGTPQRPGEQGWAGRARDHSRALPGAAGQTWAVDGGGLLHGTEGGTLTVSAAGSALLSAAPFLLYGVASPTSGSPPLKHEAWASPQAVGRSPSQ